MRFLSSARTADAARKLRLLQLYPAQSYHIPAFSRKPEFIGGNGLRVV